MHEATRIVCAAKAKAACVLRQRRSVRWLAVLLLPVACARYEPRPIDLAAQAADFAARRLDAPELREEVGRFVPDTATAWPPARWNRAELLAVALAQNPRLAVATAEAQAAFAEEAAVARPTNPVLALQSEYARRESSRWLYGLGLELALRTPDRKRLELDAARLGAANAQRRWLEQAWSVRRALVSALGDRESAVRRLDVLARLAVAQEQLVGIERLRVEAGEDAPAELVAARTALLEIAQQQAQARTEAAAATTALAAALGLPPAALDGVAFDWPDWGEPPALDAAALRDAREQALLGRADLAAAIGDYALAENALQQAVARQYPELRIGPGYYWDHGIAKWPLDVGFALPLFNRGEIGKLRADRETAGARMLAVQAGVAQQIAGAERAERVARENLDAAARRFDALSEQRRHAELGVTLGAAGRDEALGAEIAALRAGLDVVLARAGLQRARDAFEDGLHAPLSGPELVLPAPLPAPDPERSHEAIARQAE